MFYPLVIVWLARAAPRCYLSNTYIDLLNKLSIFKGFRPDKCHLYMRIFLSERIVQIRSRLTEFHYLKVITASLDPTERKASVKLQLVVWIEHA